MKCEDPELQRWIDEPGFKYIEQDLDLVLLACLDVTELCALLRSPDLPEDKKEWVVMALVEVVEHEVFKAEGGIDEVLLKPISEALREYAGLCRKVIPDIGCGNDWLLYQIISADFPHGFTTLEAARSAGLDGHFRAGLENVPAKVGRRKKQLLLLAVLLSVLTVFIFKIVR